jgi:hypothetical protein
VTGSDYQTGAVVSRFTFAEDGWRVSREDYCLAVGWKPGRMEVLEVSKGTRVKVPMTDLAPVLLLPGDDRFVGIRLPNADAVGDAFLADAADARPIHLLVSNHALNRW